MTTETPTEHTTFATNIDGLEECVPTAVVELADGDAFDLRISSVVKQVGDHRLRMLAYNGSVPGPTIRARQGSEIVVHVRNDGDTEATVHWHGLRLENAYDGVPHETQQPIPVGGEFTYRVRVPDAGLYWYHPHIREDYGLEMGLYGNLVVDPADDDYWSPVHRELFITLDDVLIEDGHIATFRQDGPTHVAMGRFGNVMLTAGEAVYAAAARAGEVVRLHLTNTANTRIFNVAVPGARLKLVGGDSGRVEREEFVDEILLAPSERAIVDARFGRAGVFALEHRTPDHTYRLGTIAVLDEPVEDSITAGYDQLRTDRELVAERTRIELDFDREPDKTLAFESLMPILYGDGSEPASAAAYTCPMHPDVVEAEPGTCPRCGMKLIATDVAPPVAYTCPMHPDVVQSEPGTCPSCGMKLIATDVAPPAAYTCPMHPDVVQAEPGTCPSCGMKLIATDTAPAPGAHSHVHDSGDGLEWEDLMPTINAQTDSCNMIWKLVDRDSGKANWEIDWRFKVGDQVKIRLLNDLHQDHPMHHPFHIHGAGRFLVLSRDGRREPNLVWKDTVLVRADETVDILLDVSNPGLWMAHCHIAEHNQSGMMFSFPVEKGDA